MLLCRRHFPSVGQVTIRVPLEVFPQVIVLRVCCAIAEDVAVLPSRVLTVGETLGTARSVVTVGGGSYVEGFVVNGADVNGDVQEGARLSVVGRSR